MSTRTGRRYSEEPIKQTPVITAALLSAGLWAIIIAVVLFLAGCGSDNPQQQQSNVSQVFPASQEDGLGPGEFDDKAGEASAGSAAVLNSNQRGLVVDMQPTNGNEAQGQIVLTEAAGAGLNIEIELTGLSPGKHGFHVHERGDCSAPDGASAGSHFNPENLPHGGPRDERQHAGDLGNLEVDPLGKARASITTSQLSLDGPSSVRGRAFIVHRDADDLKSQPSGAAGARVACGVIPN